MFCCGSKESLPEADGVRGVRFSECGRPRSKWEFGPAGMYKLTGCTCPCGGLEGGFGSKESSSGPYEVLLRALRALVACPGNVWFDAGKPSKPCSICALSAGHIEEAIFFVGRRLPSELLSGLEARSGEGDGAVGEIV